MLFDRRGRAKAPRLDKAAASDGGGGGGDGRISALSDDAIHHILSFLPSDDAVRTCVLARRWRHLWRCTRSLRVAPRPNRRRGCGHNHNREPWTAPTLTSFVNHFLLLRGAAVPVHECDILCGDLHGDYDEERENLSDAYKHRLDDDLNRAACLWIRHAVAAAARMLRVRFKARRRLCLDGVLPFAASPPPPPPLLTRVELTDATFKDSSGCIDFSTCPALQDLTMSGCQIYSRRILSPSLARLTIDDCYFDCETRTRISTPGLVSLRLSVLNGRAPLLDEMPLLVAAKVTLEGLCSDMCEHNVCKHGWTGFKGSDMDRDSCYCMDDGRGVYLESLDSCDSCFGRDDGARSVVLRGLSE